MTYPRCSGRWAAHSTVQAKSLWGQGAALDGSTPTAALILAIRRYFESNPALPERSLPPKSTTSTACFPAQAWVMDVQGRG